MIQVQTELQTITCGPKFHWFGYYDKLQFDSTGRYVLGMEVDFEHRSPRPEDTIKVGMIDLADGNRWIELGESRAWCWQQGCMLQWRPGSTGEVLWNDREGNHFVCRILDINSGRSRTLPRPVYTLSPDGGSALTTDFRRINDTRPGYGYAGPGDPYRDLDAPEESGIVRMNLETGESELVLSIAEVVKIPHPNLPVDQAKHYFNHLLFNTDGSRFVFLHRGLRHDRTPGFSTRALTAAPDGSDLCVLNDSGQWSHFIWRDPQHLLAWSYRPTDKSALYLYEDGTDRAEAVAPDIISQDSHVSYLPGGEWIVGDSYPDNDRKQTLFLYNVINGQKVNLGSYFLPERYQGEWRCDFHPRVSPDGKYLCVDYPQESGGRQIHLITISDITG